MRKYRYFVCDVFTKSAFGGNPLAVFTEAQGLSSLEMGKIAREMNLSETTFVLPPTKPEADFKVRIFTPATEIPFAGHPTLGTAYVMAEKGSATGTELKLELNIGVIPVRLTIRNGRIEFVQMTQSRPNFGSSFENISGLAKAVSVPESEILETRLPTEVISCGMPILIVPVKSLKAVQGAEPDGQMIKNLLKDFEAKLVLIFTTETLDAGSTVHARLFAPSIGVMEDPAPGAAGGPVASYLFKHKLVEDKDVHKMICETGFEIERPSLIYMDIDVQDSAITGIRVGGYVAMVAEGTLFID